MRGQIEIEEEHPVMEGVMPERRTVGAEWRRRREDRRLRGEDTPARVRPRRADADISVPAENDSESPTPDGERPQPPARKPRIKNVRPTGS
jgi:hypothetical protein